MNARQSCVDIGLGDFNVLFFNVLHGHGALMRINLMILLLHFFPAIWQW
jgi:hypothetical protein